MKVDVLIIGQGISGTFLSYYLEKEGKSFLIIDDNNSNSSSKIAAGIINPVTGRRLVTVWMVDEVLPFAWKAYQEIGNDLDITAISQKNIIDFFPNPFMRENFLQKIETGDKYVHAYPEQNHFNHLFNYEFGCGEIRPVYTAHLETLLPAGGNIYYKTNALLEEDFDLENLEVEKDKIHYEGITADKIIFCDGTGSFENPFFKQLPFAPNKGEALLVEIPGLPAQHIYKKSMCLPLWRERKQIFSGWAPVISGISTMPLLPQLSGKVQNRCYRQWLKIPFKIIEHLLGVAARYPGEKTVCGSSSLA